MPSKGFNSLTLSECEMGCRYEAMRQQWFEQRGDRGAVLTYGIQLPEPLLAVA